VTRQFKKKSKIEKRKKYWQLDNLEFNGIPKLRKDKSVRKIRSSDNNIKLGLAKTICKRNEIVLISFSTEILDM